MNRAEQAEMVPDGSRVDRSLRDALAHHYRANGLPSDGGATDPWFRAHIGRFILRLPNPPARRRAVFFHDVNHVATGYNTTFSQGEMAIAGFEIGAGCGSYAIAWYINLSMFALGLMMCPRALFGAFVRGRYAKSVYREDAARLAAMSMGDVQHLLRVDAAPPPASIADRLLFMIWATIASVVLVGPVVAILTLAWLLAAR